MKNINFEQAAFIKANKDKAEHYRNQLRECIMFLAQNTILQLSNPDMINEVHTLYKYYHEKDYSQLLFDKTEAVIKQLDEIKKNPEFLQAKENMLKAAQLMTKIRERQQNEKRRRKD